MKRGRPTLHLHGLRAQVLLWIVLPITILMIVFSFSGVQSHRNSMRAMAVEENSRLVMAFARTISAEVENYRLKHPDLADDAPVDALDLHDLLVVEHPNTVTTIVLIDAVNTILFAQGDVPPQDAIASWAGIAEVQSGAAGALVTSDSQYGDVVAYAPIPHTTWALLIREPWHSVTDPLIRFEQVMPFILLTAITASFLILFFGLRYVVRPLHELSVRVNQTEQGDFGVLDARVGGVKEIEDLRAALAEMAGRVKRSQNALHHYLGAITKAQEEERARLARELHDETVQTLIALGHRAQMAQRSYLKQHEQNPQTTEHLADLREMIAQAIEEVRRFSRALRPAYLEELGLLAAVEILADEANAHFQLEGSARRLPPEKELALYRVAQEALNNAIHHAQAGQIEVRLRYDIERVTLRVSDDGIGFDVPSSYTHFAQSGHFGMMSMSERTLLEGGTLTVTSAPGKGTTIKMSLPAQDSPL